MVKSVTSKIGSAQIGFINIMDWVQIIEYPFGFNMLLTGLIVKLMLV